MYNRRMNKKENAVNKNFILTGSDGGMVFTLATAIPLVISLIFSFILIANGLNTKEFSESAVYKYLSFALSSLSLFIVLAYLTKKHNLSLPLSLNVKKCNAVYYLIAVALAFGALFGLGWVNDWFITILRDAGYKMTDLVLPKRHFGDYILCVVIVCMLPALLEECIFRGLLLNGARKCGTLFAIIVCGGLFSLYHKNPAQTVYQMIIGVTLTLLVVKSGSIIPSVLFHFINNLYIVTLYFLTPEGFAFDKTVQIVLCVLGIAVFALCILYLIFKCKIPKSDEELDSDYAKISNKKQEMKLFLIFSAPGIVACILIWVVNLVSSV